MKKKITAIFLCVALVAIAIVGASLAYFTDTKDATNTFSMGDVKIKLDETDVTNPTGPRVTGNDYTNVRPGVAVTKDPIVYNTGSNDAYIRAKVEVKGWKDTCKLATGYMDGMEMKNTLALLIDKLGDNWEIKEVEANGNDITFVLKYTEKLAVKAQTPAMFNAVTVPAGIKNDGTFGPINITAQAIQTDSFATWEAAFNAFDGK